MSETELSDDVTIIKTPERRCIKLFRTIIEIGIIIIAVITLIYMGVLRPTGKHKRQTEEYIEVFSCITINAVISLVRVIYNVRCKTDTEGDRKLFIIINAVIGICLLFWLIQIVMRLYISFTVITTILQGCSLFTYIILNSYNILRIRHAL